MKNNDSPFLLPESMTGATGAIAKNLRFLKQEQKKENVGSV